MKKKTLREKNGGRWFFGTKEYAPGANLMNTLLCRDSEIGIPPWNYQKALDVMAKALNEEEVWIMKNGFGFFTERMSQSDMEKILAKEGKVSDIVWDCGERLLKYLKDLKSLMLSPEELYAAYQEREQLRTELEQTKKEAVQRNDEDKRSADFYKSEYEKEMKKTDMLRVNYGKLRKKFDESESKKKELEQAGSEKDETINSLRAENATLKETNRELSFKVFSLEENYDVLAKKWSIFTDGLSTLVSKFPELENETSKAINDGFGGIFRKEIVDVLLGIGIKNMENLRLMSRQSLIRMKVGVKFVDEIEKVLAEHGLGLRVA